MKKTLYSDDLIESLLDVETCRVLESNIPCGYEGCDAHAEFKTYREGCTGLERFWGFGEPTYTDLLDIEVFCRHHTLEYVRNRSSWNCPFLTANVDRSPALRITDLETTCNTCGNDCFSYREPELDTPVISCPTCSRRIESLEGRAYNIIKDSEKLNRSVLFSNRLLPIADDDFQALVLSDFAEPNSYHAIRDTLKCDFVLKFENAQAITEAIMANSNWIV